jgi:hypothetical protein
MKARKMKEESYETPNADSHQDNRRYSLDAWRSAGLGQ